MQLVQSFGRCVERLRRQISIVPWAHHRVEEDRCFEFWGKWWEQNNTWAATNTKFVIYTYGPDLSDQDIPRDQDDRVYQRAYDPSNGTVSRGDIMRSNVRSLPE